MSSAELCSILSPTFSLFLVCFPRFSLPSSETLLRLENHKHAVALHYFHYNFIRIHQTIKTTPAVKAGIADKVWTMVDFVQLLEREENLLGGRLTNYKPNPKKRQIDSN